MEHTTVPMSRQKFLNNKTDFQDITGKVIKKLNKKISAMKDERIMKKKKARKSNLDYEDVKDEKLEDRLKSTQSLLRAIQKKNQKIFSCNTLIVVSASSLAELEKTINIQI